MSENQEIRWKQRFSDYQKALQKLGTALEKNDPDEIYRAGIIQFFEMTFELGWKTLKDYLNLEGFEVHSPRSVIKTAYKINIIKNGHDWINALEKRNLLSHTYDESKSIEAEKLIRNQYFILLKDLEKWLTSKL